MLDRMDFHHPLNERRGALDGFYMRGDRLDNRLVRQIHALKFESMARGRREDREGDVFSGVKSAAGE